MALAPADAVRIAGRLVGVKTLDDLDALVRDEAWWHTFQMRTLPRAERLFAALFLGGAEAAVRAMKRRGWFIARKADPPQEYFDLIGDPAFTSEMAMQARAYATEWYQRLEATTRRSLVETIQQARREGWSIRRTTEAVRPLFSPDRAQRIAVTETTRLFGAGSQQTYKQLGVTYWHWRTAEDGRVDPTCDALSSGGPYPMSQDFIPAHVNCLLPGALISGATAIAATVRRFDGEALIIRTADGDEIAVTPNHPILSPRGWLPAKRLREGDQVIRYGGVDPLVDPDDVQLPSRCEDVAGALLMRGGARSARMPVTAENFHGDVTENEVDVIWADRDLLARSLSAPSQKRNEAPLVRADMGLVTLTRPGALQHFATRHDPPARSGVSGGHLRPALIAGHAMPFQGLGLAAPARRNTVLAQSPLDRPSADTERNGERVHRRPGAILVDDRAIIDLLAIGRATAIVSIQPIRYSGHVYNLETMNGWYAANNVITHNCRCWPAPVSTDEQRDLERKEESGGGT